MGKAWRVVASWISFYVAPAAVGPSVWRAAPVTRRALHGPDLLLLEVGVEAGLGVLQVAKLDG